MKVFDDDSTVVDGHLDLERELFGRRPKSMTERVRLDVDGAIATITNDNPDKHNAFDDEMDARLFEILGELRSMPERPRRDLARRREVVLVRT